MGNNYIFYLKNGSLMHMAPVILFLINLKLKKVCLNYIQLIDDFTDEKYDKADYTWIY